MKLKPIITSEQISDRVVALAAILSKEVGKKEKPVLICVLQGARPFFEKLCQKITCDFDTAFIRVASYEGTQSSGSIRVIEDVSISLSGRSVVIIEDIVDTGRTLHFLRYHLQSLGASSVKICTLLQKDIPQQLDQRVDYVGFHVPNVFVVGFGLDADGQYRDLPDICVLGE